MRIYVVRGGATNHEGVVQGQAADVELNERGRDQAAAIGDLIRGDTDTITDVYASDLQRAVETASHAFPDHDTKMDDRFREQDFGTVTEDFEEFIDSNPEYRFDSKDAFAREFPEGESLLDVYVRAEAGLKDLIRVHDAEDVLVVVTHYTPMLCLISSILDEDLHTTWAAEELHNGSTIAVEHEGVDLTIDDRFELDEE